MNLVKRRKKQLVCALTGGIGSGKTTIARILQEMPGIFIVNSDQIAKDIVLERQRAICRLVEFPHQHFSLAAIGQMLFSDARKKALLENYVRPLVKRQVNRIIRSRSEQIFIVESALIFESNWQEYFDLIIAAVCPERMQLSRVRKRNNWSKQKILERMRYQVGADFHRRHAHIVIQTDCPGPTLRRRVAELYQLLLKEQENSNV